MNLTNPMEYIIAISGILIIIVSFGWNIYEVFFHNETQKVPQSTDSAIR